MAILRELLLLLQTAKEPGTLTDMPFRWRRTVYEETPWDTFVANQNNT
jgi:hypothetical protein